MTNPPNIDAILSHADLPVGGMGLTADEMTRLISKFAQAADFTTERDRKIYDTLLAIRDHTGNAA